MRYEDTAVFVDANGITIMRYGILGSSRTIRFDDINAVAESRLGAWGRWRLIGAGPGGGSRNWYGWDRARQSKEIAYSFDVGRFWHPAVTPEDPESFSRVLPPTLPRLIG